MQKNQNDLESRVLQCVVDFRKGVGPDDLIGGGSGCEGRTRADSIGSGILGPSPLDWVNKKWKKREKVASSVVKYKPYPQEEWVRICKEWKLFFLLIEMWTCLDFGSHFCGVPNPRAHHKYLKNANFSIHKYRKHFLFNHEILPFQTFLYMHVTLKW